MVSIKQRITTALSVLNVPYAFLSRKDDGKFPFIVFNVSETPYDFSDDEEEGTLYMVSINIFSKPDYNFEKLKKDVIEIMIDNGFKKGSIPSTEFIENDGDGIFNQPLGFVYYEPIISEKITTPDI